MNAQIASIDAELVVAAVAATTDLPAFSPTIRVLPICDRSSRFGFAARSSGS